jgi:potassium large conductance calcium-activated channel subfamily M alpha protein 1
MGANDGLQFKHEHKIAISEQDVKQAGDLFSERSVSLKGENSLSRQHGLTSHSCFVKGDKDGNSNRVQGLISQVSSRKAEFNDISKHMGKHDTKNYDRSVSSPDAQTPHTPRKVIISLEDAIDMAMSWPPLYQQDKPDPAILERRAEEISENLRQRTRNVVNGVAKLQSPHVVVCIQGKWPRSLFYFVSHFRAPGVPHTPIVILHPNVPAASEWGTIGFFDHVYFVKGSPSYELDLVRAGVLQAQKVVILTQGIQVDHPGGDSANDEDHLAPSTAFTIDVNNVFIAATVERLLRPDKDRIIVELQQETEIQYLQPRLLFDRRIFDSELYQRNRTATYQFAPPYIDGKAFCPAALGFLMYASFYNCQTLAIVDQLICGGQVLETDESTHEAHASDYLVRQLDQIHVPKPYVDRPFEDLFIGMLREHGSLALGLYRTTGLNHDGIGFVYTNPIPTDIVEATDLVYILH